MNWLSIGGCGLILAALGAGRTGAQTISYPDPTLHYVYPAGGRQGQTVQVEMGPLATLNGASAVIVDGPPGVSVADIKRVGDALGATFTVAADASPGRRLVRVLGGSSGLTSFRYFFVGRVPELMEKEPNHTPATAQDVPIPSVVNGRINPDLDMDCFRFQAQAGQRIVVAVLAHGMDSQLRPVSGGYLDTNLELLDEQGRVLAAAEDTLRLDPLLEYTIPAAGRYTVRVQSLDYKGAAGAVYRLTLGEIAYPTCVFPAGGQRGETVEVEIGGPNVPPGTRRNITVPAEGSFPLQYIHQENAAAGGDLPFLRGDFPEIVETEPNNESTSATPLSPPLPKGGQGGVTANGRFDQAGDEDWYRLRLKKGAGILLEVTAQRHLRSPADTMLEVYDATGKKLAENDDGRLFARPNHCAHDFSSADSWLPFTAPGAGDYFVHISEPTGAGGPQAIYRLTASELKPDFQLYQWPDAVPIWGSGTTASFVVEIFHWGGLKSDIDLRVEGLPPGWTGRSVRLSASAFTLYQPPNGLKALLTLTAPADAPPGTIAPFRVIGKAEHEGQSIEHEAQYLTLYGNSHNDGMHLRYSPGARAVVANSLDSWLETSVQELTARPGETVEIPVKVHRRPPLSSPPSKGGDRGGEIGLVVNGPTVAVGCGMGPPLPLKPDQIEAVIPLTISPQAPLGTRGIVVARSWASDLRQGRPGPCTPLILLHVLPNQEK